MSVAVAVGAAVKVRQSSDLGAGIVLVGDAVTVGVGAAAQVRRAGRLRAGVIAIDDAVAVAVWAAAEFFQPRRADALVFFIDDAVAVKVVENEADRVHITMPAAPQGHEHLADEDLQHAAGGCDPGLRSVSATVSPSLTCHAC